jgi:hypothetical protein
MFGEPNGTAITGADRVCRFSPLRVTMSEEILKIGTSIKPFSMRRIHRVHRGISLSLSLSL